jgi:DNA-binding response OmpR family regulator
MRGNVLCVSSESTICESWRQHLAAAGFHVIATPEPAEGFDLLAPARFDLLLLRDDVNVSDRTVLVREARRYNTHVLIVGCADRNCGADDYIASEGGAQSVVAAVERTLEKLIIKSR